MFFTMAPDFAWLLVLVQLGVLWFLWRRNMYCDRSNFLLNLPLLFQQLGQALLWPHITTDRSSKGEFLDPALHECSDENKQFSLLVAAAVLGSLCWFEHCVVNEISAIKGNNVPAFKFALKFKPGKLAFQLSELRRRRSYQFWLWSAAVALLLALCFWYPAPNPETFKQLPKTLTRDLQSARCSVRGPHGFQVCLYTAKSRVAVTRVPQVWAFLVWPNRVVSCFLLLCWGWFCGGLQVMHATLFWAELVLWRSRFRGPPSSQRL